MATIAAAIHSDLQIYSHSLAGASIEASLGYQPTLTPLVEHIQLKYRPQ